MATEIEREIEHKEQVIAELTEKVNALEDECTHLETLCVRLLAMAQTRKEIKTNKARDGAERPGAPDCPGLLFYACARNLTSADVNRAGGPFSDLT